MKRLLVSLAFTLLLLIVSPAHAISENALHEGFHSIILPFYESGEKGTIIGQEGALLSYRIFPAEHEIGSIVISSGRTESHAKYAELMLDLHLAGYSVFIVDHRGQGFSSRLLADPEISYVEQFENYVLDLKSFVETVVKPRHPTKLYILAHSMGGAIASMYVERYPDDFRALAMSSPMLQVDTGKYPETIAYLLSKTSCQLGAARKYAVGQKGYSSVPYKNNVLTHSYARYQALTFENEAMHPEIHMGGASYRWVQHAIEATHQIYQDAARVQIPVLLFQAGRDQIVKPNGQTLFCERALHCIRVRLPESNHEVFMEVDAIREPVLKKTLQFFSQN